MHELYQTYPSSELKLNPAAAFAMADNGPVIIMARTKPRSVMVNPTTWNNIAKELNDLRALVAALRAEQDLSNPEAWTVENAIDAIPA